MRMVARFSLPVPAGPLVCSWLVVAAGWSAQGCGVEGLQKGEARRLDVQGRDGAVVWEEKEEPAVRDCASMELWWERYGEELSVVVDRPGWVISLQYRPAERIACKEFTNGWGRPEFHDRAEVLRATEHYVLRLLPKKKRPGGFDDPLLPDDGWPETLEVIGEDTVPSAFSHVEAMPSSLPYRSVLLGFDRPQDGADRSVVLRDEEGLWGGDVVFRWRPGAFLRYENAVRPGSTNTSSS